MGFSHVVAAGLILTGVVFVGFNISRATYDHAEQVDMAWQNARALEEHILTTSVIINSVSESGGTLTIQATNSGATTLNAGKLSFLLDGVPAPSYTYTVETVSTAVWPPLSDAEFQITAAAPTGVTLASEHGSLAWWRA